MYSRGDDFSGTHLGGPTVPEKYADLTKGRVIPENNTAVVSGSVILSRMQNQGLLTTYARTPGATDGGTFEGRIILVLVADINETDLIHRKGIFAHDATPR